ncbi:MAG TPA: hypothetical protein VF049_08890 [Nocardioidaceae bacterium]|jgi:hypothetical protein
MTVVLLLCGVLLTVLAAGWRRRHAATVAWHRELELAFGSRERRELPRHRTL